MLHLFYNSSILYSVFMTNTIISYLQVYWVVLVWSGSYTIVSSLWTSELNSWLPKRCYSMLFDATYLVSDNHFCNADVDFSFKVGQKINQEKIFDTFDNLTDLSHRNCWAFCLLTQFLFDFFLNYLIKPFSMVCDKELIIEIVLQSSCPAYQIGILG